MKARVTVQNGELIFTSPLARHIFFEKAQGKEAILEVDETPTAQMRRYFEGALVPAVFYQHPGSGWTTFKDAREALKIEFLPAYTASTRGERLRYGRSTTELSKRAFQGLLEAIQGWLQENGMQVPDPDDYKAWRDSAPGPAEVYPHLARLKELYEKQKL